MPNSSNPILDVTGIHANVITAAKTNSYGNQGGYYPATTAFFSTEGLVYSPATTWISQGSTEQAPIPSSADVDTVNWVKRQTLSGDTVSFQAPMSTVGWIDARYQHFLTRFSIPSASYKGVSYTPDYYIYRLAEVCKIGNFLVFCSMAERDASEVMLCSLNLTTNIQRKVCTLRLAGGTSGEPMSYVELDSGDGVTMFTSAVSTGSGAGLSGLKPSKPYESEKWVSHVRWDETNSVLSCMLQGRAEYLIPDSSGVNNSVSYVGRGSSWDILLKLKVVDNEDVQEVTVADSTQEWADRDASSGVQVYGELNYTALLGLDKGIVCNTFNDQGLSIVEKSNINYTVSGEVDTHIGWQGTVEGAYISSIQGLAEFTALYPQGSTDPNDTYITITVTHAPTALDLQLRYDRTSTTYDANGDPGTPSTQNRAYTTTEIKGTYIEYSGVAINEITAHENKQKLMYCFCQGAGVRQFITAEYKDGYSKETSTFVYRVPTASASSIGPDAAAFLQSIQTWVDDNITDNSQCGWATTGGIEYQLKYDDGSAVGPLAGRLYVPYKASVLSYTWAPVDTGSSNVVSIVHVDSYTDMFSWSGTVEFTGNRSSPVYTVDNSLFDEEDKILSYSTVTDNSDVILTLLTKGQQADDYKTTLDNDSIKPYWYQKVVDGEFSIQLADHTPLNTSFVGFNKDGIKSLPWNRFLPDNVDRTEALYAESGNASQSVPYRAISPQDLPEQDEGSYIIDSYARTYTDWAYLFTGNLGTPQVYRASIPSATVPDKWHYLYSIWTFVFNEAESDCELYIGAEGGGVIQTIASLTTQGGTTPVTGAAIQLGYS